MLKIKIWFKGYIKNRLKFSKSFEFSNSKSLFDILVYCCNEFDLPAPVILDKHKKYFNEFLMVRFSKNDFIEELPCDFIEVEIFE